jgi:hypothetical protein
MKFQFLILVSFIFIFFVSCDSSLIEESEPAAVHSRAKAKPAVERNISGSFEGYGVPPRTLLGEGIMTHLGRFQANNTTTRYQWISNNNVDFASNDIYTAANGDTLYAQTTNLLTFDDDASWVFPNPYGGTYVASTTITGGTGRFVGATGNWTSSNGVFEYRFNGTRYIGYVSNNLVGTITY